MGAAEQAIEAAIKKIVRRLRIDQILSGTVSEIGELTCTVTRDGAPDLYDVRLNAIDDDLESYVTIYPVKGSAVLVGLIEGMKTEAVVLRCSEVESVKIKIGETTMLLDKDGIVFNQGDNEGLVKVKEMVSWMQKVSSDMQTLKTLLLTKAVAGNGAPLAISFNPQTPAPQQSTFEDTKIKH